MKRNWFFCLCAVLGLSQVLAQDTQTDWAGRLSVSGASLRMNIHLTQSHTGGCSATFDSPDQGAKGIAFSSCTRNGDSLRLEVARLGAFYAGRFVSADSLSGEWSQGGARLPLGFSRITGNQPQSASPEDTRPQTPRPPFPYTETEVAFDNSRAGIRLSGTLTIPEGKGPFPAVILISGSGPQNRDEEIAGHKPFAVIADYLTRKGWMVLRYDDRGVGKSSGAFSKATTADFAADAVDAWRYVYSRPDVRKESIGLAGHSEGSLVAAMAAGELKQTAFVISLAGPGVPMDKLLMAQARALTNPDGESVDEMLAFNQSCYTVLREEKDSAVREARIRKLCTDYFESGTADNPEGKKAASRQAVQMADALLSPWFQYFIRLNPADYWKKVRCPVLALNGELDVQVEPVANMKGIRSALRKKVALKSCFIEMSGLNHLFQQAATGRPEEYGTLTQTWSESALKVMSDWLNPFQAAVK